MSWESASSQLSKKIQNSSSSKRIRSEAVVPSHSSSRGKQEKLHLDEIMSEIQTFARYISRIEQATNAMGTVKDSDRMRAQLKSDRQKATKMKETAKKRLNRYTSAMEGNSGKIVIGDEMSGNTMDLAIRKKQIQKLHSQFAEFETRFERSIAESQKKERDLANGISHSSVKHPFDNSLMSGDSSQRQHLSQKQQKQHQHQQQQQQEIAPVLLSAADEATLNVEKQIAMETLHSVNQLQTDFQELHQCFVDFGTMVKEQQSSIDQVEFNVKSTNKNVEAGVENIRIAKSKTLTGASQGGLKTVLRLFAPF